MALKGEARLNIFIAVPTYDGKLFTSCARSLQSEIQLSGQYGHNLKVVFLPGCSLISHARNQLAQQFLEDPHAHKMVFIDADVGWEPGSLMRLACHNKDVVAGIYRFKVEKESYPMGFFTKKGETEFENGLMTAAGVPMGFTAISRSCLETFRDRTPHRAYTFQGQKQHAFFDNPFVPASDNLPASLIGEDVAFCFEWRRQGGKVWVDPEMHLIHTDGLREYGGCFGEYLKRNGATYTMPEDATQSTAA